MNDKLFDALKSFIETKTVDTESMRRYLTIFILISLGTFIANSIFQLLLKRRETKENIKALRNEKRLNTAEKIYQNLGMLLNNLFDNRIYHNPGRGEYIERIAKLRQWIDYNSLCVNENMKDKSIEILDYLTLVVSEPKNRNLRTEKKMMNEFKKAYEAL